MVMMREVDRLVDAVVTRLASKAIGEKHDASGVAATTGLLHGPGGLLSYPGVDPAVFHTIVGSMGMTSQMPWVPSIFSNPLYETITGITEDAAGVNLNLEPEAPCDDAPTSGNRKGCIVQAPFGLIKRGTREVRIGRMGLFNDRADPRDLQLIGSPINNPGPPGDAFQFTSASLVNEWQAALEDRAVAMHRKLNRVIWTGSPANNNVGGGYREFASLPILVNTGYVDAIAGTSCPSMDSDVKNFAYHKVDVDGAGLVNALTYIVRTRRDLAMRTGVEPVRWAFVMTEPLFYEITKIWPCQYFLGGCSVTDSAGQRVFIEARDQIDMRDQMRAGRYLLIDGIRFDVIFDDGIPVATNTTNANVTSGCFASDIYFLPFSVGGGRAVLYGEYFQYQNPAVQSLLGLPVLARVDGAFLETPRQTNQCVVFDIEIQPRIILRTPWLAGRLNNVQYCPLQSSRQPFPNQPYFIDGGAQTRQGPSYYNLWNS